MKELNVEMTTSEYSNFRLAVYNLPKEITEEFIIESIEICKNFNRYINCEEFSPEYSWRRKFEELRGWGHFDKRGADILAIEKAIVLYEENIITRQDALVFCGIIILVMFHDITMGNNRRRTPRWCNLQYLRNIHPLLKKLIVARSDIDILVKSPPIYTKNEAFYSKEGKKIFSFN